MKNVFVKKHRVTLVFSTSSSRLPTLSRPLSLRPAAMSVKISMVEQCFSSSLLMLATWSPPSCRECARKRWKLFASLGLGKKTSVPSLNRRTCSFCAAMTSAWRNQAHATKAPQTTAMRLCASVSLSYPCSRIFSPGSLARPSIWVFQVSTSSRIAKKMTAATSPLHSCAYRFSCDVRYGFWVESSALNASVSTKLNTSCTSVPCAMNTANPVRTSFLRSQ